MDYESYCQKYFVEPAPEPRIDFEGLHGTTLFFEDDEAAVDYYQQVLGPPAYVEGSSTRGWRIGGTWLTLLRGEHGSPSNVEIAIVMPTPEEAERLQAAFIAAGGYGPAPSDQLMYAPIRSRPVRDPFGLDYMIYSRLLEG
jgi:hypothetical protein